MESMQKVKRTASPKMPRCTVKTLPTDLIIDILSRLPTDSVLECELVCKTWKKIIRRPSFARMHLRRSSAGLGFLFLFQTLQRNLPHRVYYGEFDDQPNKKLRRLNQRTLDAHVAITGSHNGLICHSQFHMSDIHEPVYISNPITKQCIEFPTLEMNGESKVDCMKCGFGYLPSVDQYKIIKIYYIKNQPLGRAQVCSLGGGSCSDWRDIGEIAYSLRRNYMPFGVFANGALHWFDEHKNIVSFNLAEEKFYLLPTPLFVTNNIRSELKVFRECLCIWRGQKNIMSSIKVEFLEIWFLRKKDGSSISDMDEKEDNDSLTWIKELSLPIGGIPLATTKSGEFLMWYKRDLCSYDPKTATMETHVIDGGFLKVFPHTNSFISLHTLGGKCMKRKGFAVNPSTTEYFITQQRMENGELDVIQF